MLDLNQLKALYNNSPIWLKKLYTSIPYDIRNGRTYRAWKEFLQSELNIEEYQLLKLKETVAYAYENTNYYQKLFDEQGYSIHDFNNLSDIQALPLIDKEFVKANFDDLIVPMLPKSEVFYVTTGGSSGEPMKFLQSDNVWAKELAFDNHFFSSMGYNTRIMKASIRGGEFYDLPKNTYWKYNPIYNDLHFSPFHINKETIPYYVNQLNKTQPKFLHVYPSAILVLIEHMKEANLKLNYQLEGIFLVSESFTPEEFTYIADFFDTKVGSFFGHSERLIFAPLMDNMKYQIDKRYGYVELVNPNGQVITSDNQFGELVGTSFDNLAMPLIRYKTGDFTDYSNYKKAQLNLIQGRSKEYLEGLDGQHFTLTGLNMHNTIFDNVSSYQYYQKEIGKVDLLIIPKNTYVPDNDDQPIIDAHNQKAGHAIEFTVKVVDQLQLTQRGKMKKLIKEISN